MNAYLYNKSTNVAFEIICGQPKTVAGILITRGLDLPDHVGIAFTEDNILVPESIR